MAKEGNITDQIVLLAVILLLIATLGTAAFNIMGNASMVANFSEPIANISAPQTVYLSNSEIKSGSVYIYNSTFTAVITTDYTVNLGTGVVTIPGSTRLVNGTAYSLEYQKDTVPTIIKTLVIVVLSIVAAICFIIILVTRFRR